MEPPEYMCKYRSLCNAIHYLRRGVIKLVITVFAILTVAYIASMIIVFNSLGLN